MSVLETTKSGSTTAKSPKTKRTDSPNPNALPYTDRFPQRHIGPGPAETTEMLGVVGFANLDQLIDQTVPEKIRLAQPLRLPAGRSEHEVLAELKTIASQNQIF